MNYVDRAVKEIDRWLAQAEISESRLGLLAAANAGAITRIRSGSAQVSTLRAVLLYIEANPCRP